MTTSRTLLVLVRRLLMVFLILTHKYNGSIVTRIVDVQPVLGFIATTRTTTFNNAMRRSVTRTTYGLQHHHNLHGRQQQRFQTKIDMNVVPEEKQPPPTDNNNKISAWIRFTKSCTLCWLVGIISMILSCSLPILSAAIDDETITTTTTSSSPIIERSTSMNKNKNNNHHHHPMMPMGPDNRYYSIQLHGTDEEKIQSNLKLLDYIIGSINTMYYDVTGGTHFDPRNFYIASQQYIHDRITQDPQLLSTRDGVVSVIHGLLNDILDDPYSSYLTREELRAELQSSSSSSSPDQEPQTVYQRYQHQLGIIVKDATIENANQFLFGPTFTIPTTSTTTVPWTDASSSWFLPTNLPSSTTATPTTTTPLSPIEGFRLPVIVAVSPNSLGERLGLTVGDRIIAPSSSSSSSSSNDHHRTPASSSSSQQNSIDTDISFVTVAKPIYDVPLTQMDGDAVDDIHSSFVSTGMNSDSFSNQIDSNNHIRGYRPIRVRIPTSSDLEASSSDSNPVVSSTKSGGNAYVHYEVLSSTNSIFQKNYPMTNVCRDPSRCNNDVGYIRLTRFSRASTKGFLDAIQTLEGMGIRRYIIDVRNNYGGVIQEAMLSAATLLRDPHMVLCYTMNSRGGLTPHDVEEYVMDQRYPGYWLSRESHDTTRLQVQREHPTWFKSTSTDEWLPMSSFASLHEQHVKRGIKLSFASNSRSPSYSLALKELQQLAAQKDIVLLINEGTASSAEVFASSLHDNGRAVALVGTKTYGKGLVQHTFPTPDGGGLRLTVVEYLTPALHHVTHVGGAQYDRQTGAYIGGGIQPDIVCDSIHGIPNNVGSDLCVGVAIDALNEADHSYQSTGQLSVKRVGGMDDGSRARRAVTIGIVRVRSQSIVYFCR